VAVIETMKAHTFNVIGSMRTYWDFFFGYGLFVTVSLLFQGILFWILASFAKTNPALVRASQACSASTTPSCRSCPSNISS
jgi:hypothetical protein